jgi:hypothetical protein
VHWRDCARDWLPRRDAQHRRGRVLHQEHLRREQRRAGLRQLRELRLHLRLNLRLLRLRLLLRVRLRDGKQRSVRQRPEAADDRGRHARRR